MPEERKTLYGHLNCVREKREGGKDPNAKPYFDTSMCS